MNNKIILIFSLLIAFTLIPFPVGALTYDNTSDNGSWLEYTSGLSSDFYASDLLQNTYNRGFESFSAGDLTSQCVNEWCFAQTGTGYSGASITRNSSSVQDGTYSLNFVCTTGTGDDCGQRMFSESEVNGDANISFWIKGTISQLYLEAIDDQNNVTDITTLTLTTYSDWTNLSYVLPQGQNKISIYLNMGQSSSRDVLIDNIEIVKNNTGTFRTIDPQYCSSIGSCSNTTYHFPSSDLGSLYWVVDYVPEASCVWAKNGVIQFDSMIEGTNGMYYVKIDDYVSSNDYKDMNLRANCIKVPYAEKSFYLEPTIYKYGNVDGGNFEDLSTSSVASTCTSDLCFTQSGTNITSSSFNARKDTSQDGIQSLYVACSTGSGGECGQKVYSNTQSSGGSSVSVWLKGSASQLYLGYVDDANSFTTISDLSGFSSTDWNYQTWDIPAGSNRMAIYVNEGQSTSNVLYIDNISSDSVQQASSLTTDNNLTNNFGLRGSNYLFTADYVNAFENDIITADCNLDFGGTIYSMIYNATSGLYEYTTGFISDGVYTTTISCDDNSFNSQSDSYSVEIISPASTILTFDNLVNISSVSISDFSNDVNFFITDKSKGIAWSVVSQEDSYEIKYNWLNDLLESNQYYVYTSSNGTNWTFNDSLTYGVVGDYNSVLQKVRVNDDYSYSFSDDDLTSGVIKYFRLEYRGVAKYWETIKNSNDWINVNVPELSSDSDEKLWDLFSDSNYSNISSYTSKQYPDLTSSDLNTGLELQFTAYASRSTTIKVGYKNDDGTGALYTIPIGTTKRKYSVTLDPSDRTARLVIQSTETAEARVYLTDYALIPKSYFVNRLEFRNTDNSRLGAIGISGTSYQVLREGIPFKFTSSAYDVNGTLATLRVEALLNGVSAKTYEYTLSENENTGAYFNWSETLSGVIDLNGWYGDPVNLRDLTLRATLIDDSGNEVAEQSSTIKLLQYPFFDDDISFNLLSVGNKVGDNPTFQFELDQEDPDRFIGFRIFIFDSDHSASNPNYTDVVFRDALGCDGFYCSKQLSVPDWVWESERAYNVNITILVNTENENYDNDLLYRQFAFRPSYRELETARILQVYERADLTYRADEKIPLVLQLRDLPYKDLSQDFSVYLILDVCEDASGGVCASPIDHKFNATKHIYDEITGYNYYYFNTLFYDDDGALFLDGNYIRFRAIMKEKTDSHEASIVPTLVDRCQSASYGTLFSNGWLNFTASDIFSATERALFGCSDPAPSVVELDDAEESRILIDIDHDVNSSQNHSLICLNADNNNNYVNNLEQDIMCIIWYKKSEQSIDAFTTFVGNENSDYSEDSHNGQYLRFDIPADYVIFNDPLLLKQTLQVESGVSSIDTLGELAFYSFDGLFSGIANPLTDVLSGVGQATGIITNYNFDLNWDKTLDPNYIDGIFIYKIKGIKVLNQYDYLTQFPVLETQNPKYFTKWALQNNLILPEQDTTIEVYASDMKPIIKEKIESNLVIFKAPNQTTATTTTDTNGVTSSNVVATKLKFNIISDMLSNNETKMERLFLPLTLSYVVPDLTNPLVSVLQVGGEFLTNPIQAGLKYWFWFVLILAFALIVSLIYRNLKSGNNNNGG